MNINIFFQICGLINILIILLIFLIQKKLFSRFNNTFLAMLIVAIICLSLDISSVIAIKYRESFGITKTEMVCKLYLASLILVTYSAITYTISDIFKKIESFKFQIFINSFIDVIGVILVLALPITIVDKSDLNIYTKGPSVYTTYAFVVFNVIEILFYIIFNIKATNTKRRISLYTWIAIWMTAAVIQFFNNRLLIAGFAMSLGIVIVFFLQESSINNVDKVTDSFNQIALYEYIDSLIDKKEPFNLLVVCIRIKDDVTFDEKINLRLYAINYVESLHKGLVFTTDNGYFVIKCNSLNECLELYREIQLGYDRLNYVQKKSLTTPKYIFVDNSSLFKSSKMLDETIKYVIFNDIDFYKKQIVTISQEHINSIKRIKELEKKIDESIEHERIEVFYQPIYNVKTKKFTAAEALMRFRDEDNSILLPSELIKISEDNGNILKLGLIVFEQVCKFISEIDMNKLGLEYIETNLSVVQCSSDGLASDLIRIMEKYNVNPKYINLEITESANSLSESSFKNNIEKLLNYGVKFSLDDFGVGSSNLNYIVQMPVNIIKFDSSLVNSYFVDKTAKYVIDATISMIKGMNLEIVFEGIETKERFDVCQALKIDFVQGFYFSKALPGDEFKQYIKENQHHE